ncbi:4'-phosphopantetheinyl transferase family protein [Portibacter marinus]|uniref:4'-phosphopantetheinyl transferase family protein n=1 Tax=Portibacter marinus TaxID=2898660 RepID=UPI001F22C2F3|nr:4'-phosphopantetheinyl transferase superfamily protein [Portibacter marinus]
MPHYIDKQVFGGAMLGVWMIEEDDAYFENELALTSEEQDLVADMKGRRSIEWLSSRHLIHLMSKRTQRAVILKDQHGKPYIHDSKHHISFSHSHGMSAAIASKSLVGIDIQFIVSKIDRIAPKFMNEREWSDLDNISEDKHIEVMHIIWGAKESLFKAYGKKSVDFKKHMDIHVNEWNGSPITFIGRFEKEDYQSDFKLEAMKINSHILVYAEAI